ncbi:DJ-1/PfpI family protein [Bosea vestrisii]|uniref:DJ-1/PfpI family protein n=1 Tax=Bosea vestrisii TaxID=151416 RepID=A0ABW0HAV7_9HYPH
MNRRDAAMGLGATGLLLAAAHDAVALAEPVPPTPSFAMLIHPKMILIDLVGPLSVFNLTGGRIHLVGKDRTPVPTELGIPVAPTTTYVECPRDVDVLFVPGGLDGTIAALDDAETIAFVREIGGKARYVTGVCTGTLLLGAAGLLKGRKATGHWYVRDLLPLFGAIRSDDRVVMDGNVVTGGGATAGLDFGLALGARLLGEEWARRVQLVLEYDPQPPFESGSPSKAGHALTGDVLQRRARVLAAAREAAGRAAARLKG